MTVPTEAQLIEMERRALWLLGVNAIRLEKLDQRKLENRYPRVTDAEWKAVEDEEWIARDLLLLVGLVRALLPSETERGRAGV